MPAFFHRYLTKRPCSFCCRRLSPSLRRFVSLLQSPCSSPKQYFFYIAPAIIDIEVGAMVSDWTNISYAIQLICLPIFVIIYQNTRACASAIIDRAEPASFRSQAPCNFLGWHPAHYAVCSHHDWAFLHNAEFHLAKNCAKSQSTY